jgi:hypothetical protein
MGVMRCLPSSIVALGCGLLILAAVPLAAQRVKYERLNWALLASFDYELPDPLDGPSQPMQPRPEVFPEKVRALNGRHVVAEGFMIPLDVTPSGASMFVLNPNLDVCMFGVPPRLTDWVLVTMPPGQRALVSHLPTTVKGRLWVGEEIRNGRVTSLYRIEAESALPRGMLGG